MKYDDYVAFLISEEISEKLYNDGMVSNEVWEHCVELAKDFEKNEYNEIIADLWVKVEIFLEDLERLK